MPHRHILKRINILLASLDTISNEFDSNVREAKEQLTNSMTHHSNQLNELQNILTRVERKNESTNEQLLRLNDTLQTLRKQFDEIKSA